jgi:hypothetical protein
MEIEVRLVVVEAVVKGMMERLDSHAQAKVLQDASKILEVDKHVPEMQRRMIEHLRNYVVDPVGGN